MKVEAGVVVFDGGKAAALEDAKGTGAEMLIGMLGDDEVEMDDTVAPEAAIEPPSADTFGDFNEASNPPFTLPPTTTQIKNVKVMKAGLVIPNTWSFAFLCPCRRCPLWTIMRLHTFRCHRGLVM